VRLAILSDVHANLEALQATLRDISAQSIDRVVCLGDIVGYNASPAECVALVRALDPICVAGNHDRAVAGLIATEGFEPDAVRAIRWTRERLDAGTLQFLGGLPLLAVADADLVAVHGALLPGGEGCDRTRLTNDVRRLRSFQALAAHPSGARVCAFGHTHRLGVYEWRAGESEVRTCAGDEVPLREDAYYLVNPGTVGHPKRGMDERASYLVLDTARRVVSVRRVEYDRAASLAKTRAAGLLAAGRSIVPDALRVALYRAFRRARRWANEKRPRRDAP
jgi:diadenosine tetraphosphatase ApaH/serine/threonine PP2A family protein phosphatase